MNRDQPGPATPAPASADATRATKLVDQLFAAETVAARQRVFEQIDGILLELRSATDTPENSNSLRAFEVALAAALARYGATIAQAPAAGVPPAGRADSLAMDLVIRHVLEPVSRQRDTMNGKCLKLFGVDLAKLGRTTVWTKLTGGKFTDQKKGLAPWCQTLMKRVYFFERRKRKIQAAKAPLETDGLEPDSLDGIKPRLPTEPKRTSAKPPDGPDIQLRKAAHHLAARGRTLVAADLTILDDWVPLRAAVCLALSGLHAVLPANERRRHLGKELAALARSHLPRPGARATIEQRAEIYRALHMHEAGDPASAGPSRNTLDKHWSVGKKKLLALPSVQAALRDNAPSAARDD
jgi:hypothetical protein